MHSTTLACSSFLGVLAGITALTTSSCGAGTAAVVAGAGGGSGGTTIQPAVSAFEVVNPKEPDKTSLSFSLSREATVQFFYQLPGALPGDPPQPPQAMTQAGANPRTLLAGAQTVTWNFALETGLEANPGASFHPGVRVFALIPGAQEEFTERANGVTLGLGNDPPVVHAVVPMPTDPQDPDESAGNVEIRLTISDTSSDQVDITVKFRRASEAPDAWTLATTTGVFPDFETIPDPGDEVSFFWNTNVDLEDEEDSVFFRVTADDLTPAVGAFETQVAFKVDNNEEPIAFLDEASLVLNPDGRGAIPVGVRLVDEESDPLRLLLQWRLENQEFPPLVSRDTQEPLTTQELIALLDDPAQAPERRRLQIAKRALLAASGTVGRLATRALNADEVRLPELASSAAGLLARGLVGRTLEILRPTRVPEELIWPTNPLDRPIAALPLEDGRMALVLDSGPQGWRVRQVVLETGQVQQGSSSAAGIGAPLAMAADPERAHLFVASTSAVFCFALPGLGTSVASVANPFTDGPRALASPGSDVVLATGDGTLLRFDFGDPLTPSVSTLLDGLSTPWGVVVDPLSANGVYVAETSFERGGGLPRGRVASVDLDRAVPLELVAEVEGLLGPVPFPSPRAIELERDGARLLVLCEETSGTVSLRGLDLRSPNDLDPVPDQRADPRVFEITDRLLAPRADLSSGPDGLRVVTPAGAGDALAIGGGVAQSRTIVAHDERTQVVTVAAPFDPVPTPDGTPGAVAPPWRVLSAPLEPSSPEGVATTFLWDSSEAVDGAQLRAIPIDSEPGTSGTGTSFKRLDTFLPAPLNPTLSTGDFPRSVAAADLNGDGALDLVSANLDSNTLSLSFQTTPGVFLPAPQNPTLSTGDDPESVAAADLNGDGALDLVSADFQSNTLSLFLQTTPGIFLPAPQNPTLSTGDFPNSVAAADLNGDGALDLVSANSRSGSDTLSLFLQTTPGIFLPAPQNPTLSTGNSPKSVAAADLNGDGALDLVSANAGSGTLSLFFQTTPGIFLPAPQNPTLSTGVFPTSVAAADLNGDGALDLVSANASSNTLSLFLQTTPGIFLPAPQNPTLSTGDSPESVAAADLNGDGALDLVSANFGSNTLSLSFQTTPGVFLPAPLNPTLSTEQPNSVAAADLNGDGALDLVSADASSNTLSLFFQTTPGIFLPALQNSALSTGDSPNSVAAADLNGDGRLDLVSATGVTLSLSFQTTPGVFLPAPQNPTLSTGDFPSFVAAADLNGDGALDVVSADFQSNTLSLFLQTTPGIFLPAPQNPTLSTGNSPRSVAAADLNGDGALDLVSANAGSATLSLFFQTTPGIFLPAPQNPTLSTGDFPNSVAAADLNGDGALDLVSANAGSNTLSLFLQTTPGIFLPAPLNPTLSTGDFPNSVAAADLNGDGALDLVSANAGSNTLSLFLQTTPGIFLPAPLNPTLSTGDSPTSVAAADLNGDGALDLVSANMFSDTLSLFLQTTPGIFLPAPLNPTLSTGDSPTSVAAADLNGDGALDLVSADRDDDTLSLFINLE